MPYRRRPDQRPGSWLLVCLAASGLLACGGTLPAETPSLPRVTVSIAPLAWLVEQLAADRVAVEVVLPASTSPESWTPTPAALLAVARSDLHLGIGHPALSFERRLLAQATAGGVDVLTLSGWGDPGPEDSDPHVWLDFEAMRVAASELRQWLIEHDPESRPFYVERSQQMLRGIEATDRRLSDRLETRRRDVVLVQHPAWGRLLGRYGIREVALEQEGKEPEATGLIEAIELVRREQIPVVFAQRELSPRSVQLVAAETGIRTVVLDPLARDWLANLEWAGRAFAEAVH